MKKINSIAAAAALMAFSILLSRLLGYVREMLLAYKFGASAATDAFYAAFQIPDLLNYFLSGGALSIAFIPLYNKILARDGEDAANRLTSAVMGTLGAIAILATALLSWQAEALVRFQFPRFDDATVELTVFLTRIVLPAQIFFLTGGIMQAVLLAHKNFQAAALAPLIYNACIIAGGYFLYPVCGIAGFAVGTLIGSIAGPFLMPVLFSYKHIPLRARLAPFEKNFLTYLALAAPLMFGQTLLTLDEWYDRWFAALLPVGSVAHISYARRLMQAPIAVIGQALAAAALPTLSKLWAENKTAEMNKALLQTLKTGLALAVLAGAAFFALARPGVVLVYQHGAFSAEDTRIVAAVTALFAFAIPGWILQQISLRAFYARGDTWRPMILGTVLSLGLIPLYLFFSRSYGVAGLALAGAIGMSLNALATLLFARQMHGTPALMPLLDTFGRSLVIALPAALAAREAVRLRDVFLPWEASAKILAFADICSGGAAFGLVALAGIWLLGGDLKKIIVRALQ